jgi:ABC-type nitrate/sulfonate/bicarbonate transport system substrate-binding protein
MAQRTRAALLAALSAAALVLTACGSGSPQAGADSKEIPFKVATSTNSIAFFPINVATKQGFFTKEGLKVGSVPVLGGDSKVAAALGGGSIDAGGGVVTDYFSLQKAGLDNAIVAALVNTFYVDIITGTNFPVPPTASLKDKILALKGKKIGVPAPQGGGEAFLNYLFSQVGMTTRDITLVNLGGSGTGAVAALKSHRVDALDFPQPVAQEVEAQKAGSTFISPARGDIPALTGQTHGAVIALTKDIKAKPEAFKRFVKAIADAETYIHDPSHAAAVKSEFASYAGIQDKTALDAALKVMLSEIPTTPMVTQQGYRAAVDFHVKGGLISGTPPTYDQATDNNFAGAALGQSDASSGGSSTAP